MQGLGLSIAFGSSAFIMPLIFRFDFILSILHPTDDFPFFGEGEEAFCLYFGVMKRLRGFCSILS